MTAPIDDPESGTDGKADDVGDAERVDPAALAVRRVLQIVRTILDRRNER